MIDLSIDFGGSGVKAIASSGDNVYAFRLEPEVIELTGDPPKLNSAFAIDLTKNMWVGVGDERFAVGLLARMRYRAPIPLRCPKLDYVAPRTLAAVAAAMARFGVTKEDLNLQFLLPSAEFDRADLATIPPLLKGALKSFDTPFGRFSVKLKGINAVPEGMGLTKRFLKLNPQYISEQVVCIMFGHRNTSLYLCVGGQPSNYETNDEGFVRAIKYAKLDSLAGLRDPSLVNEESIDMYWRANKDWLIENLPSTASIAIIGGGPVTTIEDRLTEFIGDRIPKRMRGSKIVPGIALHGEMPINLYQENILVKNPEAPLLCSWPKDIGITEEDKRQFADVYCLWATNQKVAVQASAQASANAQ
jgi:hypothetical protein